MTLMTSSFQCLPIAPGSAYSLPFKFGLTLWSASLRGTSPRSTRTALSRFSNPPHSRIQQFCSVQTLERARHPHRNPQPLMAVRNTTLLPQNLVHGIRRLHSEMVGKGSEDLTQRPDGIAGDKFSALVSSSCPMSNSIILEESTAAISGGSNKPANNAKSASPTTSSKGHTNSTDANLSSSGELYGLASFFCILGLFGISFCLYEIYLRGWEHGVGALMAQLPDCKIFTEREALRKEQKELFQSMDDDMVIRWPYGLENRRKELAEKLEKLERKELEYLRQRANVLESKLETQNVFIETVNARESPHGAVNAGVLPDKAYARKDGGLSIETANLRSRDALLGTKGKKPLGEPGCPNCSGAKADPPMRRSEGFPAKAVSRDPSQVAHKIRMAVPHEDYSTTRAKPDAETIRPRMTKPGPGSASNVILESLSADNDAAKDEMGQIRQAKGALQIRKRELEAQAKNRKKRIQELNAPKSERLSSIASSMLLGSALTFGVTMIMSAIIN